MRKPAMLAWNPMVATMLLAGLAACTGSPSPQAPATSAVPTLPPTSLPATAPNATPGPAITFDYESYVFGLAVDASGNLYVSFCSAKQIYKFEPAGTSTLVAGTGQEGFSGDGGPAVSAQLACPAGLAFHPDGSLYFADYLNNRIRRIDQDGLITTVAGSGPAGFGGDGGQATAALLNTPWSVVFDGDGALYITDRGNVRLRKVTPDGIITTIAGTGTAGYAGDGGPATAAEIMAVGEFHEAFLEVDAAGQVYFSDPSSHVVRMIDRDGVISTIAGTGENGFEGDGGPANTAQMALPSDLAFDAKGNLYVADLFLHTIRKIDTNGIITTVAGTMVSAGFDGDGGPALSAQFDNPRSLAVDADGNVYISDNSNFRIRKIDKNGIITTFVGGS